MLAHIPPRTCLISHSPQLALVLDPTLELSVAHLPSSAQLHYAFR